MRFMNSWDIARWIDRAEKNEWPNLLAAAHTMRNLMDAADQNSDGWAYWPKPARSAARLMELIDQDGTYRAIDPDVRRDITRAEYVKACAPIKAFRTRSGIAFDIVEAKEND